MLVCVRTSVVRSFISVFFNAVALWCRLGEPVSTQIRCDCTLMMLGWMELPSGVSLLTMQTVANNKLLSRLSGFQGQMGVKIKLSRSNS